MIGTARPCGARFDFFENPVLYAYKTGPSRPVGGSGR